MIFIDRSIFLLILQILSAYYNIYIIIISLILVKMRIAFFLVCISIFQTIFCGTAKITNNLSVSANLLVSSSSSTIQFTANFKVYGYIGILFSRTMTNSDCIIVILNEDGSFEVSDRYSLGHTFPSYDTKLGGKSDVINISSNKLPDGSTNIVFERPLLTGDKYDIVLLPNNKPLSTAFVWLEKSSLDYHGLNKYYVTMTINPLTKDVIFNDD